MLPHPSPRLLLSLSEETEGILMELVNGNIPVPKMECFMKNHTPRKKKKKKAHSEQSNNCLSSFSPQELLPSFTYSGVWMCLFSGLIYPGGKPAYSAFHCPPNLSIWVTKNILISVQWVIHRNQTVYSFLNWRMCSRMAAGWVFIGRGLIHGFRDGFCANSSCIMNDGSS